MDRCEYQNENGHCILNECMYGDYMFIDDSRFLSGKHLCFKPDDKLPGDYMDEMIKEKHEDIH